MKRLPIQKKNERSSFKIIAVKKSTVKCKTVTVIFENYKYIIIVVPTLSVESTQARKLNVLHS